MSRAEKPRFIDAHAHIGDEVFDADREEVLGRALAAGIRAIVAVGETLEDAKKNQKLAEAHGDILWPAAGLYPTHLDLEEAQAMTDYIRQHRDRLVAIGEVGLDHWVIKDEEQQEVQKEIFLGFVELGIELELPLNVHSRSAGRRTIDILIERGAKAVLMHAFDGRAANALAGVEAGYFFSIPPSVVRSKQKQKLVRRLPLDNILLETDSPVLGPDSALRNEPANLRVALAAVAEIKGLSLAQVAEAVTANQRRLFGSLAVDLSPAKK